MTMLTDFHENMGDICAAFRWSENAVSESSRFCNEKNTNCIIIQQVFFLFDSPQNMVAVVNCALVWRMDGLGWSVAAPLST